jgi:hypothetical protein
LQIDHVNGDGSKERGGKQHNNYTVMLTEIIEGNKNGRFQLLCANCNWIKRYENNEVRTCSNVKTKGVE